MGLLLGENFVDRVFITDNAGTAITGLTPTCVFIDELNNRTIGTVVEVGNGWYAITDFTPDADGTWCTEWTMLGGFTIHYPYKEFKVGTGQEAAIKTDTAAILVDTGTTLPATLGTPAAADMSTDIATIDEYHDVPAADVVDNAQMNEVVGNKTDAAVTTVAATKSLMAYIKGVLNNVGSYLYQAPATLNQANPVNGTFYDVLPTTSDARVYNAAVNVEDTNETLGVQIIIDGETVPGSVAATHSTNYHAFKYGNAVARTDNVVLASAVYANMASFQFEGASIQVQVRKTTAAGVGNLTGIVTHGVLTRG